MCCHPDLNQYILDVLQMVKPLLEKVFKVQFCSTLVIFLADLLDSLFKYFIWIIKLSLSLASTFKSTSFKDNSFLLSYKQQTTFEWSHHTILLRKIRSLKTAHSWTIQIAQFGKFCR